METIENTTCVKFVNHTDQTDFVFITDGTGSCKSKVGRIGGKQKMKLPGQGCREKGKLLHEMVHLLGFHHLHQSPLRDNHIKINWENVDSERRSKFNMKSEEDVTDFGTGYDYDSIVHPRSVRYSKNKSITFETRDPSKQHRIGQRNRLSEGDILRINRMYKCEDMKNLNKTELE
jgi:hypothetical protein